MLVLGRRLGQALVVGDQVEIRILKITNHHVRLGISAPDGVRVLREELHQKLLDLPGLPAAPRRAESGTFVDGQPIADDRASVQALPVSRSPLPATRRRR